MVRISISSMMQVALQSFIRPAWFPGIRRLHSHQECWKCDENESERMKEVLKSLKIIIQEDTTGSFYDIHELTSNFIRIHVFTWAEWLDIIEITMKPEITIVKGFSTGLLPLFIPFASIFNLIFFWVPFSDNGLNKQRIEELRQRMLIKLEVSAIN